jgi:hypothetical protein
VISLEHSSEGATLNDQSSSRHRESPELRLIQIGHLSEAVKVEFELVAARIGWFVASQAFLLAAYAQVVANDHWRSRPPLIVIAYAVPIIGIVASVLVRIGVEAAHSAAAKAKHQRDASISLLPMHLRYTLVPVDSKLHLAGNLPASLLPTVVIVFWFSVLAALVPQ